MADSNPITPLSKQEIRKGEIDISRHNPVRKMEYNKRVEKYCAEMVKQSKPFCNHCAIMSKNRYDQLKESEYQHKLKMGQVLPKPEPFEPDFSEFTKTMEFVNTTLTHKTSKLQPVPQPVWYKNYKCTECGGAHSIEHNEDPNKPRKRE